MSIVLTMNRIISLGAAALVLVGLVACTTTNAMDEAVKCLEANGIVAEVKDGVIIGTQYANDDAAEVPREQLEECIPEELRY